MTREEASEILKEVLSDSDFRDGSTDLSKRLLTTLRDIGDKIRDVIGRLEDALDRLLSGLHIRITPSEGGNGGTTRTVGLVILVFVATVLVCLAVLTGVRWYRRRARRRGEADNDEELTALAAVPEEAFRLAEQYRRDGEYRSAFRYLFISLLTQMNLREIIRIRPYKTNRVYRREILNSGCAAEEQVTPFFSRYNSVWFGKKEMNAEEYDGYAAAYIGLFENVDHSLAAAGQSKPKPAETSGKTKAKKPGKRDRR